MKSADYFLKIQIQNVIHTFFDMISDLFACNEGQFQSRNKYVRRMDRYKGIWE